MNSTGPQQFRFDHRNTEDDPELYALSRTKDEERLAPSDGHLLVCRECQDRLAC